MLILNRRLKESIVIGDNVTIKVLEIHGHFVRIGITAPKEVPVWRDELWIELQAPKEKP